MATRTRLISVSFDGLMATFTIGTAGSFTVDASALNDDVKTAALLHGLKQKISDAAAIPADELTGNAETDARTKFDAMKTVADNLGNGEWSQRSSDGSGPIAGLIYRAFEEYTLARFKKAKKDAPTTEAIRAVYDRLDRAGQLALKKVPEIGSIMDRIRAEKGPAASVDTDALLSDLGL